VLQAKERTPIPYPFDVFTFRLAVESTKEFGGASSGLLLCIYTHYVQVVNDVLLLKKDIDIG
jgi:hypothetical protein